MYFKYLSLAVFCSVTLALQCADPTATVTAVDAIANETAGNTGTFRITFSASKTSATTVAYTIATDSTAINGTDYTNLSGSVVMPANATTVDIVVTPVNDVLAEGAQTVRLVLAAGTGYTVGNPNNATVTIEDNEVQEILTSVSALSLFEGQGASINVTLKYQPEAELTEVSVAPTVGTNIQFAPDKLFFTPANWNTGLEVTTKAALNLKIASINGALRLTSAVTALKDITVASTDALDISKTSLLTKPAAFDAVQFANNPQYRTAYLAAVAPNRVNLFAQAAINVPVLRAQNSLRATLSATTGGNLTVVAAPNAPVTFCTQDEGLFRPNFFNCVTVQADAAGVATAKFIPARVGAKSRVLVACPSASGQLTFVVTGQ